MANEEYDQQADAEEEEEEWVDLEEIETMQDGPSTIFVGGFSKYKTINDALEAVLTSNDRIVVLESFDGDVVIDATRFAGVTIAGATSRNTIAPKPLRSAEEIEEEEQEMNDGEMDDDEDDLDEYGNPKKKPRPVKEDTTTGNIDILGKLTLSYSDASLAGALPTGFPDEDEEDEDDVKEDEEDEEDDADTTGGRDRNADDGEGSSDAGKKKKETDPHSHVVSISSLTFTRGLEMESQTGVFIEDCAFGTRNHHPELDITVKVNGLSTGEFTRCRFFGGNKASLYCYPSSRCKFIDSDVIGTVVAEVQESLGSQKKPRGYVAPSPPPPAPPLTVTSATGILSDDSSCTFENLDVSNFGIGMYCIGLSKGLSVTQSRVKLMQTVGLLCDQGCQGRFHEVVVTLCGRECAVLGSGHPTVRECTFVGDVRLKRECISTGVTDNIVALPKSQVLNEDTNFNIKGFRKIPIDPTVKKIKKFLVG